MLPLPDEQSTHHSNAGQSDGDVAAIVLAAGRSTRMRSKLPKPLHPICGLPMTTHVIRACRAAGVGRIVVVVGHEAHHVRTGLSAGLNDHLSEGIEYALQEQQRGTGDAVRAAEPFFRGWQGTILILAGDIPLIPATALRRLIAHRQGTRSAVALLTAFLDDPTGYGRIVRDTSGAVARIVEERDASPEERAIREWNPSIYAYDSDTLWPALAEIRPNNAQGEFYLTDTVGLLATKGVSIAATPTDDSQDVLGVNTRIELAAAAGVMRRRLLNALMLSGVTVTDPATTYVDVDVEIGQDSVIEPHTHLLRGTRIGEDCVIGPYTRIENSRLGNRVRAIASHIEESVLDDGAKIGPYAHLRPGAQLGAGVKIGNFVEVKNAVFSAGAQASHLSYIGDAEVGEGTNIGAGTITCNYDGYNKHRTIIGKRVFVGSHSTLVAPVTIGDGAFLAAGSPITTDVPADALAIARERTVLKEGWAAAYHVRQAAAKVVKSVDRAAPVAPAEQQPDGTES
jgi:bifunctional UDP-N-acetylglucosamine pyrophosphorylase / glucosamine-1-phosphate N-acetyltransferase